MNIKNKFIQFFSSYFVKTKDLTELEVKEELKLRMGDKTYNFEFFNPDFTAEGKPATSKAGEMFLYAFSYNEHVGEKGNRTCKIYYKVLCIKTKETFVIGKETFELLFCSNK